MQLNAAFQMMRQAILSNRSANAYLIVGPAREGGLELATRVLQTLFCCQTADQRPCNACERCRRIVARLESDAYWIFPEKKSRVIGVDQIREQALRPIGLTSLSGGWKAAVLVGADRLNESSGNAFLKTLEEPPDRTLFLLLTDAPHQILPTIVSRCQWVDISESRELGEPWRDRVLEILASPLYASPIERLAMSEKLDDVLTDIHHRVKKMVREENDADPAEEAAVPDKDVFEAKVGARYREIRSDLLITLLRWFRDLLVLRAGGCETLVQTVSKMEILKERAQRLTLAQALHNLQAIEDAARQLERNLSEKTVLACALDRMHHGLAGRG